MNLIKKHHSKILWVFTLTAIFLSATAYLPATPAIVKWLLVAILALSGGMVFWLSKEKLSKSIKASKSKNKWLYPSLLILLVILAFALRVINLTDLEPHNDEYIHLVAAMGINQYNTPTIFIDGQMMVGQLYHRAYFLTTFIAFLFAAFGKSLFLARLPGVIISSLTAIPFYFLGKRINKPIGLIMAGLWAISPWSIAVAKNVREYAYFPFLYILFGLFLIVFTKHLIRIIEKKDWKITWRRMTALATFFLPIIYFYSDQMSTFRQIFILYIAFFITFFYGFFRSRASKKLKKRSGLMLAILAPILLIVYTLVDISHVYRWPAFDPYWFNAILGKADTTFFYQANHYGFYILFVFAILFSIYQLIKSKYLALNFLLLSFLGYFYFYIFHFKFVDFPRHGFVIHVWLIPLVSVGIYLLFQLYWPQKNYLKKAAAITLMAAFFLTIVGQKNIVRAIDPASYQKENSSVPITGEFHERFVTLMDKYDESIKKDDVIMCSHCTPFYWHEKVDFDKNNVYQFILNGEGRFEKMHDSIIGFREGWIIMDADTNDKGGFPKEEFWFISKGVKTVRVNFIEKYSDFYIYHWQRESIENR